MPELAPRRGGLVALLVLSAGCGEGWWEPTDDPLDAERPVCAAVGSFEPVASLAGADGGDHRGLGWEGEFLLTLSGPPGAPQLLAINPLDGEVVERLEDDGFQGDWRALTTEPLEDGTLAIWVVDEAPQGVQAGDLAIHRLLVTHDGAFDLLDVTSWGLAFEESVGEPPSPVAVAMGAWGQGADPVLFTEEAGEVVLWDVDLEGGVLFENFSRPSSTFGDTTLRSVDASPSWILTRQSGDTRMFARAAQEPLERSMELEPCVVTEADGLAAGAATLTDDAIMVITAGGSPQLHRYPWEGAGGLSALER